jgi:hypothetical protein
LTRLTAIAIAAAVALVAQAGNVRATSFTWDTTVAATDTSGTLGPYTVGGQSIYAVGYEIIGGTTAAAKLTDTLMPATNTIATVGGGIGVQDTAEANTLPANAVNNTATSSGSQVTDMVAFALPGNGYYPTSITLHQYCANGHDPGAASCASTGSTGFDDVSIFVGGIAGDLPTGATTLAQLVSTYGFTQLTSANLAAGSSLNGSGDRTITLNGNIPGAYIIIAASLSDPTSTPDNFKVASLTANKVAEPGTLAVFGVGLAGIALARRRRQRPGDA